MAYVTMEATMLICPAERFLYVLYWLQKGFFFLFYFFLIFFLGLQRSPVGSDVAELRAQANPQSCGIVRVRFGRFRCTLS